MRVVVDRLLYVHAKSPDCLQDYNMNWTGGEKILNVAVSY